jgi:spermidine/putrescine transport system permease protein
MSQNKLPRSLVIAGILIYIFLYLPIIILILYSFNDSRINVSWVGFTLKWYKILLDDKQLMKAFFNSLVIAAFASLISVILGTFAGVALHKHKIPILSYLVMIPVAAPELLIGVSLLLFFMLIHLTLGYVSITLAHIAFCLSFVTISVKTRMHDMDDSVLEAARDLGANSFQTFYLVLIPMILPGIIAGGLMAFTLSIDDFVITFFTTGVDSVTLPIAIYSMLKMGITPEINAISTMLICITLILILIARKLSPQMFKS